MLKIAIGGALGRVGRSIVQIAQEDPKIQLIASVVRPEPAEQSKNLNPTNNLTNKMTKLSYGLSSVTDPFDVLIDFSNITCLDEHLALCCERKQCMVIGVTGLSSAQKEHLLKASKIIPIVYSPNMSIGINLSFKLLEMAAKVLRENVGVAIQDIHHQHKKDRPSGTALKMGEIIAKTWGKNLPVPEIDFASSRVAEVLGDHNILFALEDERLEIKHITENRSVYARGALRAAKWIVHQSPGLYDMQDVLGFKV